MVKCKCNLIDWSASDCKYIYIPEGNIYDIQKHGAIDCRAKVKEGILNYEEYFKECKYIPGDPKSNFPSAVSRIKINKKEKSIITEGIPPISRNIFIENKET
tara:strand:- start:3855 stop:4160 length:306 start_codon:yes stop_codon:yes gene_type:complete